MVDSEKLSSSRHSLRDAAERFTKEGRAEARQTIQKATEAASEVYEEAGTWLQENYGKAIALVGVMTLAGVAGYILGRNNLNPNSESQHL